MEPITIIKTTIASLSVIAFGLMLWCNHKKKHSTKEHTRMMTFSMSKLLEIASVNGFVITQTQVVDTVSNHVIDIDLKQAAKEYHKTHTKPHDTEFTSKIIMNRAIRAALTKHTRFTDEVIIKYIPDIVF